MYLSNEKLYIGGLGGDEYVFSEKIQLIRKRND